MRRTSLKQVFFLGLAASLAACGGAQFKATPNQPAPHALKPGIKPQLFDTADTLAQPALVVGVLTETTKNGEDDRKLVERDFKLLAAGHGCDAIVGMKMVDDAQKLTQKVWRKDPTTGKAAQVTEEVETHNFRWSAQCVRSAAPGGAAPAPNPSEVAPGAEPEVAAAPDSNDPAVRGVVAKLAPLEGVYLRQWKEKLHASTVEPLDAVGAVLEVMVQVDKFWKITVPTQWLGCAAEPENELCVKYRKMLKDLRKSDDLRHELEHLNRSVAALGWLRKNGDRVAAYVDTYVPTDTSESAMRTTPFWTEHQAP